MPTDETMIDVSQVSLGQVRSASREIGGRWALGDLLGSGTSGDVFRATDPVSGRPVAVKLLQPMTTDQRARVRREITALRVLRLPGVVNLLDDGEADGRHFIVMDLVDGARFPGREVPRRWDALAPLAISLLQTLGRIHAAGIVHRDLKPANVLVDAEGNVTILDFGLARGRALGETITSTNALVGTPRYLAPEQLSGLDVDGRVDLYAAGVMFYEHLAGRPPHVGEDVQALYVARLTREPTPIECYVPDIPEGARRLLHGLLARRPTDRPATAEDALALYGLARPAPTLPRLGDDGPVRAVVEAAAGGRSVDVAGEPGMGRSRVLADAAERLAAAGRQVFRIVPGERPFESLRAVLGAPPAGGDAPAVMADRLVTLLADGAVIVADDAESLDYWTRSLLARCRGRGAIVRAAEEGEVHLRPLSEADLRPLFRGPDRLLHLQEDGARELYRRTGGVPGRVAAEVAAWVSAGLAELEDGQVVAERGAVDRLSSGLRLESGGLEPGSRARLPGPLADLLAWIALAWPNASRALLAAATGLPAWELDVELEELLALGAARALPDSHWETVRPAAAALQHWAEDRRRLAHRALADASRPGEAGRLAHLVAAGALAEAGEEALAVARALGTGSHVARAMGVLEIGLNAVEQLEDAPGQESLLFELTRAAAWNPTSTTLRAARVQLGRARRGGADIDACRALLEAGLVARTGNAESAQDALEAMATMHTTELEEARQNLRYSLVPRLAPATAARVLADLRAWAARSTDRAALWSAWLAGARYREERYPEAAVLYALAARSPDLHVALPAAIGGAIAQLGAGALDEATAEAGRALRLAREHRATGVEARAEWALRSAAYRRGDAREVDRELVAAVRAADMPWVEAQILLGEAAVAWRTGERETAAAYASESATIWGRLGFAAGSALAEALAGAIGAISQERADELAAVGVAAPSAGLTVQILGLLAAARPRDRARWRDGAERAARRLRGARGRLEVLEPAEALAYCRGETV